MSRFVLMCAAVIGLTTSAFAAGTTYSPQDGALYAPTPTVQAHVDLYGGAVFFNGDSTSDTAGAFGGAGRANVPFGNGWNLQIDAQSLALLEQEGSRTWSYPTEFSGYAHVYKQTPGSHALGVFGGASWLMGPQVYTAGVEGQMYWQHFTLYGQASASALKVSDISGQAVQLRGQGQWFATDNTAVFGDLIWTDVDLDGSVSVLSLAGTVMHRFADTPIAAFGKVRWDHISVDGYGADNATTVLVGLRIIADPPGGTLRSSLQGVPMNVEPIQFGFLGVN